MRKISSSWTWWNKKAVPTIFFGFLALWTSGWTVGVFQGQVPALTLLVPLVIAVVGYVVMRQLVFSLVDEVWIDGDDLIVRNRDEEGRFPIANVVNVDATMMSNPERIVLTLRTPSRFGCEIAFSPPMRLWPFGRHPLAKELIRLAHGMDG